MGAGSKLGGYKLLAACAAVMSKTVVQTSGIGANRLIYKELLYKPEINLQGSRSGIFLKTGALANIKPVQKLQKSGHFQPHLQVRPVCAVLN